MKALLLSLVLMGSTSALVKSSAAENLPPVNPPSEPAAFLLKPIGTIEKQDSRTCIRVDPQYQRGLLGLEQWSHLWVVYWFDKNDTPERRAVLQVHPRGNPDHPLTGVFACRSPMRPNLVALSLCRILSVEDNVIVIEDIDAFDQTPVIDLKPYARGPDTPQGKLAVPRWAGPSQP